jgi:hypothetical protein
MNAVTPIEDAWTTSIQEVNAWRGAAIHHYGRIEAEVGQTLLALRSCFPDVRVSLDHLAGARFVALRRHAVPVGLLPDPRIAAALQALEPFLERRVALCHGVARVALQRSGAWLVAFEWTLYDKPGNPVQTAWFAQDDALSWLADLRRKTDCLASLLRRQRAALAPASQ